MNINDLARLDWKTDRDLVALQGKVAGIAERERQGHQRSSELTDLIRKDEQALVGCRAAGLLDEVVDGDEGEQEIRDRLGSYHEELSDIKSSLEAIKLAQAKLEPAVKAAESEAKLRIVMMLLQPYQSTAEDLKGLLEKAVELNKILHAIHLMTTKQNLTSEIHSRPALKSLSLCAAWNVLSQPNGSLGGEFQYWRSYIGKIFGDN